MASPEYGYDDERFQNTVSRNLHCVICFNVFNDPVMCRRNQHTFCRPCITRHLENAHTCPTCMDELTVDTLSTPSRALHQWLSELSIRCDYYNRGCHEFVQLGELQSHTSGCAFAPVTCSNEGCVAEVNRRDRAHHEIETCQFRKQTTCHDCAKLKEDLATITEKLRGMETQMKINFVAVNDDLREIKMKPAVLPSDVSEVKRYVAAAHEEINEVKVNLTAVQNKMDEMKMGQNLVNVDIKENLLGIRDDLTTLTHQMNKVVEMGETPEGASKKNCHFYDGDNHIVIAGGNVAAGELSSVERFCWLTKTWTQLKPMKERRDEASSFIFQDQFIVTGGYSNFACTDSMEKLDIKPDQGTQPWFQFPAKLPCTLSGHSTVVYHQRLIVIGGREGEKFCDGIYEVSMRPPYASKLLIRMAHPRSYHGAQLIDDLIVILGGRKSEYYCETVDSVVVYDITKNECRELAAPLLYAVSDMATVRLGDNVALIGGTGQDGQLLSTVLIHNIKTGTSQLLPQMKCAKEGCVAVFVKSSIVVMGGQCNKGNSLKLVERFSLDSYSWEDLPPMKEARSGATAVAW